jgi:hypothetical protein
MNLIVSTEENQVMDMDSTVSILTKDDSGHYNSLKQCIFKLLDRNVSTSQIPHVMQTVLNFAGVECVELPRKSTINEWHVTRLILAQKQVAEALGIEQNLCLLSDETSKFGLKYQGYHACTSDGKYLVLGLRNIASKSGKSVLSTLQEILSDIDSTSNDSENDVSKRILTNIASTMSDRAATQIKFNELLEDYHKDILPLIIDNYDSLTDSERTGLEGLCNFFCGLHVLVHMAETASSCLKEVEMLFFDNAPPIWNPSFKSAEPGGTRLVRTTCKALTNGGDDKCVIP